MSVAWWDFAVSLAQWVILAVIGLHQWLIGRDRVRRAQIEHLERAVDTVKHEHAQKLARLEQELSHRGPCTLHMTRLTQLEERLAQAPTSLELEKLYNRINPLAVEMSALNAHVKGLHDNLSDIRRGLADLTSALLTREEPHR